jgi:hypothetical protein
MTGAPDRLEVAGLKLPIVDTALGPRISPEGELAGLAIVVNAFLNGALPQLWDGVVRQEPVSVADVHAEPLPEAADPAASLEPWRRMSRSSLAEDPVVVGVLGEEFVLPRAALLTILDRLQHLNEPGLLKTRDAPTDSPAELLARAVANRPGAPGRAEELPRLETRARELDAMTDPAEAAARRRALLIELDGAGVLSGRPEVADELNQLQLPTLLSYQRAARRLLDYLVSPERGALVPDAIAEPVLGARVSLDFFRDGPRVPPGRTEHGWAALGEAMLVAATPEPTAEGRFYSQWDGRWYDVRWRRDDGNTPALLDLSES